MNLYKYTKLKYALDIIQNERLYLSKPEAFNDPFDCVLSTNKKAKEKAAELISNYSMFEMTYEYNSKNIDNIIENKESALKFLEYANAKKVALNLYPRYGCWIDESGIAKEYINKHYDEIMKNRQSHEYAINKKMKDIREDTLIGCLTKNNNSLLMWSHYGDAHKGVCIEFEIEPTEKDLIEVRYSENKANFDIATLTSMILAFEFLQKPIYDQGREFNIKIMEPFYTKSNEWGYEQEYRYILNIKNHGRIFAEDGKYYLKSPRIKTIIFGCRVNENDPDYNKIVSICKEKNIPVKYLDVSEEYYSLEEK